MRLTSRFPPRLTPRFPSRFAPQELTPSNLSLLRPGLLAAGYRAPFEQPVNERSYNGQEAYFAALTTRAPLGPLVAPRFVPYASRRVHGMRMALRGPWRMRGERMMSCVHDERCG